MPRPLNVPFQSKRLRKRQPLPVFEQLRGHRIAHGLTQANLAKHTGYSKHVVERMEMGIGMPSMKAFLDLCDALKLTIILEEKR